MQLPGDVQISKGKTVCMLTIDALLLSSVFILLKQNCDRGANIRDGTKKCVTTHTGLCELVFSTPAHWVRGCGLFL